MSCPTTAIPPLVGGERLTRGELERRFDATPGLQRAELVEGVVHFLPPRPREVGSAGASLVGWLGQYCLATPGVEAGCHGHIRLDEASMLQPQAAVFLPVSAAGRHRVGPDGYLEGEPELVADVDGHLDAKLEVYPEYGIREYLVWRVPQHRIEWHVLRQGGYAGLVPHSDGTPRSEVFPGMWLDPAAMIARDMPRVAAVLQQGLATPEHAAFIQHLRTPGTP